MIGIDGWIEANKDFLDTLSELERLKEEMIMTDRQPPVEPLPSFLTAGIHHDVHVKPLGHPTDYPYTSRNDMTGWSTWNYESHIERLYAQVNLLLAYIKELEAQLQGRQ